MANAFWLLLISRMWLGVGVGYLFVTIPVYVSELAPYHLRGKYVLVQMVVGAVGVLLVALCT